VYYPDADVLPWPGLIRMQCRGDRWRKLSKWSRAAAAVAWRWRENDENAQWRGEGGNEHRTTQQGWSCYEMRVGQAGAAAAATTYYGHTTMGLQRAEQRRERGKPVQIRLRHPKRAHAECGQATAMACLDGLGNGADENFSGSGLSGTGARVNQPPLFPERPKVPSGLEKNKTKKNGA
jgi:hypothetical protein